ncbi:MAG: DUF4190 domain-containing protein [Phycisphaerae bacterium]
MPVTLKCPACEKLIAVEVPAGTQVQCPLCNQVVTVPDHVGLPTSGPPTMPYATETNQSAKQGLAIAALVCGCVGLVGCPLVGLAGIVLGIVALVKINRDASRHRGKGLAIGGICTGVGSFFTMLLLFSILLPAMSSARNQAKRTVCAANLRGLGQAMYLYAQGEPNGEFPDNVGKLVAAGLATTKQFNCPSDISGQGSYYYVPGYGTSSDPEQIIMYEDPRIHAGEGINVLYQDGHVVWLTPPQLQRDLSEITLPDGTPYAPHEE